MSAIFASTCCTMSCCPLTSAASMFRMSSPELAALPSSPPELPPVPLPGALRLFCGEELPPDSSAISSTCRQGMLHTTPHQTRPGRSRKRGKHQVSAPPPRRSPTPQKHFAWHNQNFACGNRERKPEPALSAARPAARAGPVTYLSQNGYGPGLTFGAN